MYGEQGGVVTGTEHAARTLVPCELHFRTRDVEVAWAQIEDYLMDRSFFELSTESQSSEPQIQVEAFFQAKLGVRVRVGLARVHPCLILLPRVQHGGWDFSGHGEINVEQF